MTFEYKAADVSGLQVEDEGNGVVTAIVSVTGLKDSVDDIIEPGAYNLTLKSRKPKGIWHHSWLNPISKTLEAKELMPGDPQLPAKQANGAPWPSEAGALLIKQQFNLNTQRGRDAYEDVKFYGPDQEWSIGYKVPPGGAYRDRQGVRHIKSLQLFEYSPVLVGTMPVAHTLSVKSAQEAYKSGDFDLDYDPSLDPEYKAAEGLGLDNEEVLSVLADLIPQLTQLQGWLTQSVKRDQEMQAELDRLYDTDQQGANTFAGSLKSDDAQITVEDIVGDDDEEVSLKSLTEETVAETFQIKSVTDYEDTDIALIRQAGRVDTALGDLADDFEDEEKADAWDDEVETYLDLLEDTIASTDDEGEKSEFYSLAATVADLCQQVEDKAQSLGVVKRRSGRNKEDDLTKVRRESGEPGEDELGAVQEESGEADEDDLSKVKRGPGRRTRPLSDVKEDDDTEEKSISTAERNKAEETGAAMPGGRYPIRNASDLRKAIHAFGRGNPDDKDAIKSHIRKRAKALGLEDKLPESWGTKSDDTVRVNLAEFDLSTFDSVLTGTH